MRGRSSREPTGWESLSTTTRSPTRTRRCRPCTPTMAKRGGPSGGGTGGHVVVESPLLTSSGVGGTRTRSGGRPASSAALGAPPPGPATRRAAGGGSPTRAAETRAATRTCLLRSRALSARRTERCRRSERAERIFVGFGVSANVVSAGGGAERPRGLAGWNRRDRERPHRRRTQSPSRLECGTEAFPRNPLLDCHEARQAVAHRCRRRVGRGLGPHRQPGFSFSPSFSSGALRDGPVYTMKIARARPHGARATKVVPGRRCRAPGRGHRRRSEAEGAARGAPRRPPHQRKNHACHGLEGERGGDLILFTWPFLRRSQRVRPGHPHSQRRVSSP